jgi:cyclopropane fatty-acyl-phospholipid synthase-like methyltransferase
VADTTYDPAEHYDRVTEAWGMLLGDELHYGVFESAEEPLARATARLTERMIESARLSDGIELLDVGCGTGAPACRLAREFGVRVLGITTSAVGVQEAAERAEAEGVADLARFEVRDGSDNGLEDASFDRVWALESSHLIRDRAALIGECARVLRPGGRLVLCDIIRRREIPFAEVRRRMGDFVTLRTAFGDAHMEPLELYAELAESSGLVVEESVDLSDETLPTFDRWRENAERNSEPVRAALGADGFEAFVRSTEILEGFWRDGSLGYGLFAARKPDGPN